MTHRHAIAAALAATLLAGPAGAQDASPADPHAGHETTPMAVELPAACTTAAADEKTGTPGPAMAGSMSGALQPAQAGNMAAMEAMHGPMMEAALIEDADLAFNCAMIAHHLGAIAMARVELEHGKDAVSRRLAETIVAAQEQEIAAMTAWIEARAK